MLTRRCLRPTLALTPIVAARRAMLLLLGCSPIRLLVVNPLRIETARRYLVPYNQMGDFDALLRLLQRFLVAVKLREDGAELQPKPRLELQLVDPDGQALVLLRRVIAAKVVESGLEAKGALLQLTLFLIAHGHVVEELESDELISAAPGEVNDVEHAVSLLKEQQGIVELVPAKVCHSALVELAKHHRNFVYKMDKICVIRAKY